MEPLLSSLLADIMREKKSTTPAKAYSYLRFSTPEQMSGDSYRRQTELAKRYAQQHALTLDDQLTYQDLGVSGFSGANAASGKLAEFLEAVEHGVVPKGSVLLVESLDRLSRQTPWEALPTIQRIVNSGITLVTLMGEPKVYNAKTVRQNPMALMEFLLIATRAYEESATKQRRATEAWKASLAKASNGEARGASAGPSWLRASTDRKSWEVIPDRVATVQRVFELAKAGMGKDSIAELFNTESVPTFGASRWWGSYIARIIGNRAVIGEHTPHEKITDPDSGATIRKPLKTIKGYYPTVIPKKLWDEVAAMQGTNPRRGRHAKNQVANIFGGIARCPRCGNAMTRKAPGKNNPRAWPALVCSAAKAGLKDEHGAPVCIHRSVGYNRLESVFLSEAARVVRTAPRSNSKGRELEKQRRNWDSVLQAAEDQLERLLLLASKSSGRQSMALIEKIQELEKARTDAKEKLASVEASMATIDKTLVASRLDELETVAAKLQKADAKEAPSLRTNLNAILRRVLKAVVVDYEEGTLRLVWHHSDEETAILYTFPKEA